MVIDEPFSINGIMAGERSALGILGTDNISLHHEQKNRSLVIERPVDHGEYTLNDFSRLIFDNETNITLKTVQTRKEEA